MDSKRDEIKRDIALIKKYGYYLDGKRCMRPWKPPIFGTCYQMHEKHIRRSKKRRIKIFPKCLEIIQDFEDPMDLLLLVSYRQEVTTYRWPHFIVPKIDIPFFILYFQFFDTFSDGDKQTIQMRLPTIVGIFGTCIFFYLRKVSMYKRVYEKRRT